MELKKMEDFLNENIRIAKFLDIPAKQIYERYLTFCEVNSIRPLTFILFNKEMVKFGFKKKRTNGGVLHFKDVYLLKCKY
jgi:hypothetical protein